MGGTRISLADFPDNGIHHRLPELAIRGARWREWRQHRMTPPIARYPREAPG
jgi:hypothetical protein